MRSAIAAALTPARAREFDENGFVVLGDSPLPEALAEELRLTVQRCFTIPEARTPNCVEFLTSSGPVRLTKPHVLECDLHQRAIRERLPAFDRLFTDARADGEGLRGLATLFARRVPATLGDLRGGPEDDAAAGPDVDMAKHATVKLQLNRGSCFPWHHDNPGRPSNRRLTMAVYLTANWAAGGELVLQPFMGPAVTVPPRHNTVVLFRSDLIAHRVLPAPRVESEDGARLCFTIWFDGARTNTDEDVLLREKHLRDAAAVAALRTSPLHRQLSRVVYDAEYRRSLIDCFGEGTKDAAIALALHEAHCKPLLANPLVAARLAEIREQLKL